MCDPDKRYRVLTTWNTANVVLISSNCDTLTAGADPYIGSCDWEKSDITIYVYMARCVDLKVVQHSCLIPHLLNTFAKYQNIVYLVLFDKDTYIENKDVLKILVVSC